MTSLRALSAAFLALAVSISPAVGHDFQTGSITIDHPWSRATPPIAPVAGGYLTLTNNGGMADRLVSISSPLSERAEIHESTVSNGVASMRPVQNGVEIEVGETVELQPGGMHIMFMKPSRPLKEGERFAAKLTFEQAGTVEVEFVVQGMGAGPATTSEHDGHGEPEQ
ncbi:copper chaperone PCu(A)C [Pelagibacterium flavum]|uniref:Copper chaperone PCu(A)C n=1 Tax=Pelagibacterium flavum TaxID=2984530 RepID=A0ABY6IVS2_9HYPH|nr:copper chaperone PCu(A)C [Pelagibacterium sp. YIM 151497]UYQ73524.1 copper chaperone PCu(A)C [Pelagibacterium sp. YIM 151497]